MPLGPKTRASCSPDLGPPSSRTRLLPPPAPQSSGVTNGHRVISRRICWKRGPGCFPGTEVTPPSRGGSSQQAFPSRASVGTAATPLAVAAHLPAPQPATLSRPRREGHGMAPRPPFPRAQAERGGAGRSPQPRLTRAPRWLQPRSQLASSGPEAGSRGEAAGTAALRRWEGPKGRRGGGGQGALAGSIARGGGNRATCSPSLRAGSERWADSESALCLGGG